MPPGGSEPRRESSGAKERCFRVSKGKLFSTQTVFWGQVAALQMKLYDAGMVGTGHSAQIQPAQKGSPEIDCRLELIPMHHYWLINYNEWTVLMQDVCNGGNWACGILHAI